MISEGESAVSGVNCVKEGMQPPGRKNPWETAGASAETADLRIFDSKGKGRKRSALLRLRAWKCLRAGQKKRLRHSRKGVLYIMESLILAQNERWRRVLSMQVERQGG